MQKPSNPGANSDQTQSPILVDVWFLAASPVEEKNTLESGFDLFMGFWRVGFWICGGEQHVGRHLEKKGKEEQEKNLCKFE